VKPSAALDQARAAVARLAELEAEGEKFEASNPDLESPEAAEFAIRLAFTVAEEAWQLSDAFQCLDQVCRLQEEPVSRPWWRFWS
jgi:hypothetical protein